MSVEPAPPTGALALEASARLLGAYAWVERRLFVVLGAFAADEAVPAAALHFETQSQHHAWHAELFGERLPLLPGLDHETLVAAPPGAEQVLGTLGGASGTLGRLAGLARVVLPRMVAGYRAHLARAAPVADAPVVRALRLAVRDEIEALLEGEALLERLAATDPPGLGAATDGLRAIESGLAGVGPGLVAWPA